MPDTQGLQLIPRACIRDSSALKRLKEDLPIAVMYKKLKGRKDASGAYYWRFRVEIRAYVVEKAGEQRTCI